MNQRAKQNKITPAATVIQDAIAALPLRTEEYIKEIELGLSGDSSDVDIESDAGAGPYLYLAFVSYLGAITAGMEREIHRRFMDAGYKGMSISCVRIPDNPAMHRVTVRLYLPDEYANHELL